MNRLDFILKKVKKREQLTEEEATDLYNGVQVLLTKRGGGKTSRIIKECKKNGGILITFSVQEAERIEHKYLMHPSDVVSCQNLERLQGIIHKDLYIDNADLVLERIFNKPIAMITLSRKNNETG